jgi:hypothetical protein
MIRNQHKSRDDIAVAYGYRCHWSTDRDG